jgi:ribosomal protein L7/L12
MKTEIVNVPGKGICILISDIDVNDFIQGVGAVKTLGIGNKIFTNINVIADCIRVGKKIAAIKEIRAQTGWGLKEAKEYADRFITHGRDPIRNNQEAENFIRMHLPDDFIENDEFKI